MTIIRNSQAFAINLNKVFTEQTLLQLIFAIFVVIIVVNLIQMIIIVRKINRL